MTSRHFLIIVFHEIWSTNVGNQSSSIFFPKKKEKVAVSWVILTIRNICDYLVSVEKPRHIIKDDLDFSILSKISSNSFD